MKETNDLPLPERILHAAFVTFVERGYDNASMDDIAASAGTTKRTVYARYGSKEALFRASIGKAVLRFLSELPDFDLHGSPEAELEQFATRFSDQATWRRAVLLQRVVIGEAERSPDLGEMLYREIIVGAERRIADFLEARFAIENPSDGNRGGPSSMDLARLFLNMATGPQRFATLMEARKPAPAHPMFETTGTDADWIRLAVRFFLDALDLSGQPGPGR
jgi:AcrR family transcriptional regulator